MIIIVIAGAVVLLGGTALVLLMRAPAAPAPASVAPATPVAAPVPPPAPEVTTPEPVKPKSSAPKTPKPIAPAIAPVETAPTTGTLHVVSDVAEASVFIDRKFVGTAPVTAPDLAPGPHHLNVSAAGYDAVSQDLDIAPGPREVSIKFKEIRLDASIHIVHKHAMGSCTGTLSASPQGVRYETANKNDAFTVTLTGIETFEVDYLSKNLKLKVKNGKTYNFTDPDGNADRLFVFHRDVEKARQRLLAGGGH